jgi:hypothetical protein
MSRKRIREGVQECRSSGVQDEGGLGSSAVLVGAAAIHAELLQNISSFLPLGVHCIERDKKRGLWLTLLIWVAFAATPVKVNSRK